MKIGVGSIPARDPDDLRWDTMHCQQIHKILILAHDGGTRLSSGLEYFQVTGVSKAKRGDRLGGDRKCGGEPGG